MHCNRTNSIHPRRAAGSANRFWSCPWGRAVACIATLATLSAAAQHGQQMGIFDPNKMYAINQANRLPDVNDQMAMRQQAEEQKKFEDLNALRRKQLTQESAALLKLAADLKAEMDKTDKDTLNLNIIRKADEIQKLAQEVENTMKVSVGR
jgi:hypothetical protein